MEKLKISDQLFFRRQQQECVCVFLKEIKKILHVIVFFLSSYFLLIIDFKVEMQVFFLFGNKGYYPFCATTKPGGCCFCCFLPNRCFLVLIVEDQSRKIEG